MPVLVDEQEENRAIADSSDIVAYIDRLYPAKDVKCGYKGPAADACSGILPKLAGLLKNQDTSLTPKLKEDLKAELNKLNEYLASKECSDRKFLLGDDLSDLDCSVLPKLFHVQVAAMEYKNFAIPREFAALWRYIEAGQSEAVWNLTCPPPDEVTHGWSRHGVIKEN